MTAPAHTIQSPTFLDMNGDDIREAAGMSIEMTAGERRELTSLLTEYLNCMRSHYNDTGDLHWWICHMIATMPILDSLAQRYDLDDIAYVGMFMVYGIR